VIVFIHWLSLVPPVRRPFLLVYVRQSCAELNHRLNWGGWRGRPIHRHSRKRAVKCGARFDWLLLSAQLAKDEPRSPREVIDVLDPGTTSSVLWLIDR
jgi:hypothetical protein